jgi:arginyl-tRNA synthetase
MATAPSSSPQGIHTASFKGIHAALNLPALPSHPSADPARHPLDAFLLAAAEQVAAALDIDFDKAWQGTQLHSKGADIIVTVPRFRLPGKPADVAQKVVDAVSAGRGVIACAAPAAALVRS